MDVEQRHRIVDWLRVALTWQVGSGTLKLPVLDPAEEARERQAFIDTLSRDVLVQRYVQQAAVAVESEREFYADEPWKALADQRLAALTLAEASQAEFAHFELDEVWPSASMLCAALVLDAQTYLWRYEVSKLAVAAPLPKHVIASDVLQHDAMFWSNESADGAVHPDGEQRSNVKVDWVGLFAGSEGFLLLYPVADEAVRRLEWVTAAISYGAEWPSLTDERRVNESVGQVLKRCAFLSAPFVGAERHRLPREIRREQKRLGQVPEDESQIAVVELRQAAHRGMGEEGEGIDYRHRWWVRGHYRAQWYASLQAHRVIFIAPHLKGPENAPLLEKVYDVRR